MLKNLPKMLNIDKNLKHKKFVEQIYLKCQELQDENDRFAARVMGIKKMIKKRFKETNLLKSRLDRYNDEWRTIRKSSVKKDLKIRRKKVKPDDSNCKTKLPNTSAGFKFADRRSKIVKAKKRLNFD